MGGRGGEGVEWGREQCKKISSFFDDIVNPISLKTAMQAYKPISADFMESIE